MSKEIIANVKNTMSDCHIVQKNFNQLLEKEVLSSVSDGWSQISEDERVSLTKINKFSCGMHFMVGLADTASAVLNEWEGLESEGKVSPQLLS